MLKCHLKTCGTKDKKVKWLRCEECGKGFCDYNTFSRHGEQKHPAVPGDDSAWYHCGQCPKKFSNLTGKQRHIKDTHSPEAITAKAAAEAAKKKKSKKSKKHKE